MRIVKTEGYKQGINFSPFVIRTDKKLLVKFAYKVGGYTIYVNKRLFGGGYVYNVSYVTNDPKKFIPKEVLLGNDLIE